MSTKKKKRGKLKIGKIDEDQPTLTQAFRGGAPRIDPSAYISTAEAIARSGRDDDLIGLPKARREDEVKIRNSKMLSDRTAEGWGFCKYAKVF